MNCLLGIDIWMSCQCMIGSYILPSMAAIPFGAMQDDFRCYTDSFLSYLFEYVLETMEVVQQTDDFTVFETSVVLSLNYSTRFKARWFIVNLAC